MNPSTGAQAEDTAGAARRQRLIVFDGVGLAVGEAFAVALGTVPLLVVAEGSLRHASERGRAIRMVAAVFLTLLAAGIIISGLFLPILQVSAGIR